MAQGNCDFLGLIILTMLATPPQVQYMVSIFLPAAERSRSISRFSSWDQSAVQESKKPEQIISIFPPFYLHQPHAPKLAQI